MINLEIIEKFLTPNKYSRPQTKLTKITKIAIHYVGNAGSTAIANRNYFENLKNGINGVYASSHFIVGLDGEIIQCLPLNEIAYTTNQANSYSIGIETCHPLADGKFNDKTNQALIELCSDLCKRYNLNPLNDLIRHFDITGKKCPLYHVNNPSAWTKLKQDVYDFMNKKEEKEDDDRVTYIKYENVPSWGQLTIKKLMDKKLLLGNEKGELNLSESVLRVLVINDRAKLYD